MNLSVQVPRDWISIPLVRHLARDAMAELGVVEEDAADVQLALTEACANVMDHSGPGDAAPHDDHVELLLRQRRQGLAALDHSLSLPKPNRRAARCAPSALRAQRPLEGSAALLPSQRLAF